ncbi:hypothetical protein RF55_8540 [Lasius niger]|uniref:Uncharacterized protein n=1 Tax=Lasius niger TaxID=67767 RepID=A0A0J7KMV9_LASNI|nr:hypothetical protein RF55_8540 [Lasius niger]
MNILAEGVINLFAMYHFHRDGIRKREILNHFRDIVLTYDLSAWPAGNKVVGVKVKRTFFSLRGLPIERRDETSKSEKRVSPETFPDKSTPMTFQIRL